MNERYLKTVKAKIEEFGVFIQVVACGEDSYAYTIGMAKYGLPDAIVFCPDHKAAHLVLNLYSNHVRVNGQFYGKSNELLQGNNGSEMPVYVSALSHTIELQDEYVVQAFNFYAAYIDIIKSHDIEFVQLMIPDKFGNLPNEPDYKQSIQPQQVLLGGRLDS
jgi:hypothetical protein